eukprot:TRINITY_DN9679_c0_g1_i1.p1 TRINITY_DN9679_c0_g1~~TRINITY_DN9679_c0_g1_i1.p1  ORF type:complete len:280 (+),score=58.40 TRINITY_DN9679_c0_g1_i1:54-893(+)
MLVHLFALFVALSGVCGTSIGDQFWRTYGDETALPMTTTDATKAGWSAINGTCDSRLGIAWSEKKGGPSRHYPITLFFTPGGQISGVGITIYGNVQESLVNRGWFEKTAESEYFISASFRPEGRRGVCSETVQSEVLGTQVRINQNHLDYALPLTETEVKQANYSIGACFKTMGHHYFRDFTGPTMSWVAENLQPVVPMYFDGKLVAFFFTTTEVQQQLVPPHTNEWEPIALINTLMCKNWCDSSCHWEGARAWSTIHFYLNDYNKNTCANGCSISCCP